ncbi:WD-40 repeat-containing protein [Tubulinosema ratisbonensis]|uniref:WD-40 repeat-containing protein n=1 Tax=Tubulinosema ratisbonensis TaxID=291195 RepID=A0A437ANY2_9MICR|nr:WD-40 repeat-containing protein [Tubulinosema ratisbonensis]
MYRHNFLQMLENLKKEFEQLANDNSNLRAVLKKHEEKAGYFHNELKLIKSTIVELQSQIKVKKFVTEDLPKTYSKTNQNKKIKIGSGWSVEKEKLANISLLHTVTLPTSVSSVQMSPCGNFLGIVCASTIFLLSLEDYSLLFLNHKSNRMEEVGNNHKSQILKEYDIKLLFSKDSKFIFTDNGDNCIRKWCMMTKMATRHLLTFTSVGWGFYQNFIAMADNKSVILYDLLNQLEIPFFEYKEDSFSDYFTSFLAVNDEIILLGTNNGKIILLKENFKEEFSVHSKSITSLAVKNNKFIFSGSVDKTALINFLDLRNNTLNVVGGPLKHDDSVLGVKFFEDSAHFVTNSRDSTFRIWDKNQKEMRVIAHNGPVTGIATKGRILVSAGDKKIRVWDVDFNL